MTTPSHVLALLGLVAVAVLLLGMWQSAAKSSGRSEAHLVVLLVVAVVFLVTIPPALSVWTQGPSWPSYLSVWPENATTMQKYLGYAVLVLELLTVISLMGSREKRRGLGAAGVMILGWQAVWLLSTQNQGQQLSMFLLLLPLLAVILIKGRLEPDRVFALFLQCSVAVCTLSVLAGFLFADRFTVPPNRTFGPIFPGRLVGVIDDPNLLGAIASIVVIGSLYRWTGFPRIVAVLIGALTIAFTDSRTALVACLAAGAAGILGWLLAHRNGTARLSPWGAIAVSSGGFGLVLVLHSYLGSQSDLSTLDGRRQIWDSLVSSVSASRLIGLGAAAFTSLHDSGVVNSSIGSGHNAWIDTYVHAGLLGLALGVKAFRAVHQDSGLSFSIFVLLVVRSISEPQITIGYLAWNSLITLLLLIIVPVWSPKRTGVGDCESEHGNGLPDAVPETWIRNSVPNGRRA